VAAKNEDFVILACTVLIQIKSVTGGQTERQTGGRTDTWTMAKTGEALHAVARKNCRKSFANCYELLVMTS